MLPNVHGVSTINEESTEFDMGREGGSMMGSPMMEEKDPLDAIERRETVSHLSKYRQPFNLDPSASNTIANTGGERGERPRFSETESTIPLLSQRNDSSEYPDHRQARRSSSPHRSLVLAYLLQMRGKISLHRPLLKIHDLKT